MSYSMYLKKLKHDHDILEKITQQYFFNNRQGECGNLRKHVF